MDYLLQFAKNPWARKVVSALGQPVNLPPALRRSRQPLSQRVANDVSAAVGGLGDSPLWDVLGDSLAALGFRVELHGPGNSTRFEAAARAWAEPCGVVTAQEALTAAAATSDGASAGNVAVRPKGEKGSSRNGAEQQLGALLFDATQCRTRADLDAVYRFFHLLVPRLARNGRVLVLGAELQPATSPEEAAYTQALEGFSRSLAKEVGRKGTTCNLVRVQVGAEARALGPLRFFLSERSAFVTGQVLHVHGSVLCEMPSSFSRGPLAGKLALVTGSARGIGAETARVLAREGARVIVLDHPSAASAGGELARELGGEFLALDLSQASAATTLAAELQQRQLRLDVVVHNAGITRDKTLARMSEEQWNAVLDVNLDAILKLNEQLLQAALLAPAGRMVLLSSVGGIAGNAGQTNYASAKAALIEYARVLAEQLAPRGITVNAVAPGFIETQMTARMPVGVREAARRLASLNQGGLPQDVAETILFFCLPDACGVSGSVLRVCGGALIGA